MGRRKRNTYSTEFKAKVSLELLSGEHTLNWLAEKYQIAPATLSSWHRQFQEKATEVFRQGPKEHERLLWEKEKRNCCVFSFQLPSLT